jgi:hypothetical protein
MNKLIEEFKNQAWNYADRVSVDGDGQHGNLYLEMLSQLIINECSKIASDFSMNKHKIHPDIEWDEMGLPAQFAAHATAQLIADEIKQKFNM